jgi:hypothetical protein
VLCDNRRFDAQGCGWCDERQATGDVRATIDASTSRLWLVRRATRDRRRAGDDRRLDARQEKQPINKSNILSEHGQHYLPFWEKERLRSRTRYGGSTTIRTRQAFCSRHFLLVFWSCFLEI